MPDICAQTYYGGAWRVVCQKGTDDAEGRAWLARQIKDEFGEDAPVTYLRMDERGLYQPITGMCEDGCNCRGATCKGRPRNRPPQAGAGSRSGKRPPRVGEPVHAEDVDMDDADGDMDMQEADVPEPMWGRDRKKPRRNEPERPAESEADAHGRLLALVSSLIQHVHATRGREGRKELAAAMGNLPRTMAGESLRKDAELALAVTAPPRPRPNRIVAMLTA
jgi:hypothetical protein